MRASSTFGRSASRWSSSRSRTSISSSVRAICVKNISSGGSTARSLGRLCHVGRMNRSALLALTAAGLMFGVTVPLSKLALGWLDPTWLAVARFGLAAPVLALVARQHAARGGHAVGRRVGRARLRRDGRAAEPRGRADERHARRADLRRRARVRGRRQRARGPRGRRARGVDRLRGRARRRGAGGRLGRRRVAGRRRARARLRRARRRADRGPGRAARGPRPGRRDGRADGRRGRVRAARRAAGAAAGGAADAGAGDRARARS